jgi:peptide deformylase
METKLKILTWPNRILRKKCKKVKSIDDKIKKMFNEMRLLLIESKGVGLAANQVGVDLSLALIEIEDKIFKIINPCITKKEGKVKFLEGCLSFPDLEVEVERAKKVWVSYLNEHGEQIDLELDGVLSIIFQHEIDHLNGILITTKLPFLKKLKIAKKLSEIKKKTKNELRKHSKKS